MPLRKTDWVALLLISALAAGRQVAGAESGPHREGNFWVETTSGSEAVAEGEQLKITALGDVVVKGGDRGDVSYTLTRRVRARSLAEAQELLQNAESSLARHGRYLRLAVDGETGPATLVVNVPRKLAGLLIGTNSGSVDVSDCNGNVLAQMRGGNARIHHVKGAVDITTAGGSVHLEDIGGWAKIRSAGGDITADSIGGQASLETAGGDIIVQSVGADIRASTGGGKVRIGQAGGSVVASNGGGGAIDIGKAAGTVSAHNSGGGPILIGSAGGIECENASGAIKAGSSGVLRLMTAAGSVIAQLQGDKLLSNSFVTTGSGDITVFLPSNLHVTVRAQNDGATRAEGIISEFPALRVSVDGGAVSARGVLNGGGPLLQIQGTSGTIWIRKKK